MTKISNNSNLFEEARLPEKSAIASAKSMHYQKKSRIGNLHLFNPETAGYLGLQTIEKYNGKLPRFLVPFNQAQNAPIHSGTFVHFYIDDYLFERLWNHPERYLDLLKRFSGVIGPDFSQCSDMPYAQRLHNCHRNRLLGRWMQDCGINYIHNVTWSLPDSYDYSFSGLPKNSVIAINSNGIRRSDMSVYLHRKGYEEALRRLQPKAIIRYGAKMPYENEAISMYFENERLNLLKHGR